VKERIFADHRSGFTIDTNAEAHKLSGSCPLNHCDNFSCHGTAAKT
jgi:hypothetical protein